MDVQHKDHLKDVVFTQTKDCIDRLDVFKVGMDSLMLAQPVNAPQDTIIAINNWVQGFVVSESDKQRNNYTEFLAAVGTAPQDLWQVLVKYNL